jgi:hypothetical protein
MRNECIWVIHRQAVSYLSGATVHIPRGANELYSFSCNYFTNIIKYLVTCVCSVC